MGSQDIIDEISVYEEEKISLIEQMDALFLKAQTVMPEYASKFMNNEVQRSITNNSELVELMDSEKLGELKTRLNKLLDSTADFVKNEFLDQKTWQHHISPEKIAEMRKLGQITDIYCVFRKAVSRVGGLLNEYELLDIRGAHPSWKRQSHNDFVVSHGFGNDYVPQSIGDEYDALFNQFQILDQKIFGAKKRLSSAKASELWNDA